MWTRTRDIYQAGDKSDPRYAATYIGKDGLQGHTVQCYIESSEGAFFELNTDYDTTDLTAHLFIDGKEEDEDGKNSKVTYVWYFNNVALLDSNGKQVTGKNITVDIDSAKNGEFYCIISITEETESYAAQGEEGE